MNAQYEFLAQIEDALNVLEQAGLIHEESATDLLAIACRNSDTDITTYQEWANENL